MTAAASKPDRTLVVILSVIGILVVVALVAVFSRGEPTALDASTPAGVVQRYAAAVIAGDEATAVTYLAPDVRAQCEKYTNVPVDNLRITLVSTTERAASADVKVSLTTSDQGGPFGSSEYATEEVFDLVKVDGNWFISTTPWSLTVCSNAAVK